MKQRSPLAEPMVWLVIGLPAASVFAGFWLLSAAMRSGASDSVRDDVTRTGQIQQVALGPDQRARAMHASALLTVAESSADVFVVSGNVDRKQALVLLLSHPTDQSKDRQLTLHFSGSGWQAPARLVAGHDWLVQLSPPDGSWRLHGRLRAGESSVYLSPALSGD